MDEIDRLEQVAVQAWPPAVTARVDGWLLRATPGVQRRRSTAALPPPGADPARLAVVLPVTARFAADHGQPHVVQVSPVDRQGRLDAALAERGWTAQAPTAVLTRAAGLLAPGTAYDVEVGGLTEQWLQVQRAVEQRVDWAATVQEVFDRMVEPVFLLARHEGQAAAAALLSRTGSDAGLFCVGTRPGLRGRGLGTALLRAAAVAAGHRQLWLQVGESNPARRLYERVGFRRRYGYRYRVAPAD